MTGVEKEVLERVLDLENDKGFVKSKEDIRSIWKSV